MLAAGLDGIEKGMKLADPVEESLFEMTADRVLEKGIVEMPGSLGEAIEELEKDEVIAEALGEHVYSHYLEAKREEWESYNMQITQWELDRYLEAY
jgi:glutamine synthetase